MSDKIRQAIIARYLCFAGAGYAVSISKTGLLRVARDR